jgi:hypothetical protein
MGNVPFDASDTASNTSKEVVACSSTTSRVKR